MESELDILFFFAYTKSMENKLSIKKEDPT